MGQYSKEFQGTFTSDGSAEFIPLAALPVSFEIVNKTQFAASPVVNTTIKALGFIEDADGTAYQQSWTGVAQAVADATIVTGGFTWVTKDTPVLGPASTGTAITAASPAVATSIAHGFETGDTVWLTETTGMLQIAGLPWVVTVLTANSYSIDLDASGFAAPATNLVARKLNFADLYVPYLGFVSDVVVGATTTVTTSVDHGFVVGQEVRLTIPSNWGMVELDALTGFVLSIPSANEVVLDINSTGFTAFAFPTSADVATGSDFPQVYSVGDQNFGYVFDGTDPLNRVVGAFFANTSQGVIVGTGDATITMHAAADEIHWKASFPDQLITS